ncbi:AMP-binding protein, partial [Bacillus cereus]
MFDRSPEQIISFLAILQAGAIYLPLDVTYPQTRLKYMLEDSRCTLVLTDDTTLLTDVSVPVVTIDKLYQTDLIQPETGLTINQDDTAYLIYTSGTTGAPKGTAVPHRGIVNVAEYFVEDLHITPEDRIVQFASCSFDASVWEISMALLTGASLHLVSRE